MGEAKRKKERGEYFGQPGFKPKATEVVPEKNSGEEPPRRNTRALPFIPLLAMVGATHFIPPNGGDNGRK